MKDTTSLSQSEGSAPPKAPDVEDVEIFLTGDEAFPALEEAFLDAETEIWAGFRVFDLTTRLRSDRAREVGETWFDLIVHTLRRQVALTFILSDFDPIVGEGYHAMSWRAYRQFMAAREMAGADGHLLTVSNNAHPARVGILPRLALWRRLLREVGGICEKLNGHDDETRRKELYIRPGLLPWIFETGGKVLPRRMRPPSLIPGTHHQKMAVFDRERLYIGGLDLDERRYDDLDHSVPHDETWYDVQLMCRGPVVAEAQEHLETFQDVTAGRRPPARAKRLLRTLSSRRTPDFPYLGPRPLVSELAEAHHAAIERADKLIYLETQYFRDRKLTQALARAAAEKPDLNLILILPAAPETVAFVEHPSLDARFGEYVQSECIRIIREAFGNRLAICSPVSPEPAEKTDGRDTLADAPIIYVHAKVSIFDDDFAIVSSANLNGRSLYWDTETGVRLEKPEHVARLKERVVTHWLPDGAGAEFVDPDKGAAPWRAMAEANAATAPEERKSFLVPYDTKPAEKTGRFLPFIPEEMV